MYIAILEYETGEVIIETVPKKFEELDGDDILTNMGYSSSNTNYMIVDNDLHLVIDTDASIVNTTLTQRKL